jgi:hypothetical protein
MPARLLFLDFDGVLHPASAGREALFSPTSMLEAVLPDDRCRIVMSSSWRHHYPFEKLVAFIPVALRRCVVGTTGDPHVGRWPRYHEIKTYLARESALADWRALDDSRIEFPAGCVELILCDPNLGIQESQMQLLRGWLDS